MDQKPTGRLNRHLEPLRERVQVDNVWATPSTLHMRVTIWNAAFTWRQRHDVHVPVAEIPREAVDALWTGLVEDTWDPEADQLPLF